MRELYHSKIAFNTAIIKCKKKDVVFDLHYHLLDNPVQHIWQHLYRHNGQIITKNYATVPVDESIKELKVHCNLVNFVDVPDKLDQEFLNKLHNEYVMSDKSSSWLAINDLIHVIESKLNDPLAEYDSTLSFYMSGNECTPVPLKEDHKLFLNTDIKWGRMNLGYGTLGKDWLDISKNNDETNDLTIQSTASTETLLSFCVEPGIPNINEIRFHNWASRRDDVPIDNLNKIALGRYPLGQLIITDTLLDFHNNPSDWYVPNHRCKLLWNKEVFNSAVQIHGITFENTDMCYNSFVNHSNVKGILNV